MANKTYGQICGIAAALDRVGERWTLLILRELSFGEQRFTDLKAGLPGIATNLLTDRLRDLESEGLIEQRELPPPAARSVYALTESGARVRPVLKALARFGLDHLEDPTEGDVRPRMAVFSFVDAIFDGSAATSREQMRIKFALDGETHWIEVRGGRLVRPPVEADPDVTVAGSAKALLTLVRSGHLDVTDVAGLAFSGDRAMIDAFARLFRLPELVL